MENDQEQISLANLKGGAAIEMFDRAMRQVIKNLADPNTEPKAKREITLKVTFQATEDRALVAMNVTCTPKLSSQRSLTTTALIQAGQMIENKPRQIGIFTDNVKPMERKQNDD